MTAKAPTNDVEMTMITWKIKNNIFFRLLSKGALTDAFLPERSNLEQTNTFLKIIVGSTGVQTANYKRIHAGLSNQF